MILETILHPYFVLILHKPTLQAHTTEFMHSGPEDKRDSINLFSRCEPLVKR